VLNFICIIESIKEINLKDLENVSGDRILRGVGWGVCYILQDYLEMENKQKPNKLSQEQQLEFLGPSH
jgi:hypothetical protein